MAKGLKGLITLIIIINVNLLFGKGFDYYSPSPNSILNSIESSLIFKTSLYIDNLSIQNANIIVTGNKSGLHYGKLAVTDDNHTVIFVPDIPFATNEKVTVKLKDVVSVGFGRLESVAFSFYTSPQLPDKAALIHYLSKSKTKTVEKSDILLSGDIPSDFPPITIDSTDIPSPGNIFLSSHGNGFGSYTMILDSSANPIYFKKHQYSGYDIKPQPTGLISFSDVINPFGDNTNVIHYVMDTSFTVLDSFQCKNGMIADFNEFKLLPNGHALLLANDIIPFDMSLIVEGGNPNTTVILSVIQEQDADKNVVFQWRSLDYIPLTDSDNNLSSDFFDHVSCNAFDLDYDGNIIASLSQTDEIIKISRQTGEVMWRLGGMNNQFTFEGEKEDNKPFYFSKQNDLTILPNRNILIFDNAVKTGSNNSRVVEYELDEQNKSCKLVWEYYHNPPIYSSDGGSAQRLVNGNTLICWGNVNNSITKVITEVRPDKSITYEMSFPSGITSFRAYKRT
ncbi:MAG: hypothetical protein QG635_698, partial [Bacteroidota bacterium]|nr:hypothetical protein [Bacteroidota bacterium]